MVECPASGSNIPGCRRGSEDCIAQLDGCLTPLIRQNVLECRDGNGKHVHVGFTRGEPLQC